MNRYELRQEARPELEGVGERSAETVIQAARGEASKDDQNVLGNGVLLRQAGYEATKALWNSTLANLGQRRTNRAMQGRSLGERPELSESVPTCDQWGQKLQQKVAEIKEPELRAEAEKAAKQSIDQCKEITSMSYTDINPRYKPLEDDPTKESLQMLGPQKEDALERDARVQLEVMARAGISASDVPANWQYTEQDDKARMTLGFDDNAPREGEQTVAEQLAGYNRNLEAAEEGYKEVQSRLPDLQNPKPTQFAIQPGERSMLDINQPPETAFEDIGLQNGTIGPPAPETYNDLVKEAQSD